MTGVEPVASCLASTRSTSLSYIRMAYIYGDDEDRTRDLRLDRALLYR